MVSMAELLQDARKGNYAVGSFNITSTIFVDAILSAAKTCKSPVILAIAERHIQKYSIDLEAITSYIKTQTKNIDIPLALHLDHGQTFECIENAINLGFASVMLDRSNNCLEENIADTKSIVNICKKHGISVEGEIGSISGEEGEGKENIADINLFTEPSVASKYVEQTGIDCLAIAIGNVHGRYKGKPNLDFARLEQIRNTVDIPLVLHGGSGISDEQFRKLINLGINKINFYSGNVQSSYEALYELIKTKPLENGHDIILLFEAINKAVQETTMSQIDIFNNANKISIIY